MSLPRAPSTEMCVVASALPESLKVRLHQQHGHHVLVAVHVGRDADPRPPEVSPMPDHDGVKQGLHRLDLHRKGRSEARPTEELGEGDCYLVARPLAHHCLCRDCLQDADELPLVHRDLEEKTYPLRLESKCNHNRDLRPDSPRLESKFENNWDLRLESKCEQ